MTTDNPTEDRKARDLGRRFSKRRVVALAVSLTVVLIIAAAASSGPRSPYQRLRIFAKVLAEIEKGYVEPVNGDTLVEGAVDGMVRTLDPHSSFLKPSDFKMLEEDTRGEFGGVGLEVGLQDGVITVIAPIPGSPAARAGLEPGDRLLAIDKQSTENMGIVEAVHLMRGKPGSKVTGTFSRTGVPEPFDVALERAVIKVDSVESELLAPGIPWIRVQAFQDGTTADVKMALERLQSAGGKITGVLLDLRRNPGGVLQEAVLLSDLFVSKGIIVTTRGRGDKTIETYRARRWGTIDDVPVVAIIDGGSASAAEIVAGALQDHGRALVVGTRSFGKGSVQSLIELGDGYGLKLTMARYFTPLGRSIQAEGVAPDVVVESRQAPVDVDPKNAAFVQREGDLPNHLAPAGNAQSELPKAAATDFQLQMAYQLLAGMIRQKDRSGG